MNIIFNNNKPKYIQIYDHISKKINNGSLKSNTKLPSKRNLAIDLNVSLSTIENAYFLLLDEGYIYTLEKKGYYVSNQDILSIKPIELPKEQIQTPKYQYDFTTRSIENFNNQNWKKVINNCLDNQDYLLKTPTMGDFNLREVIANHLKANRGINTSPHNILITTGLECFKEILPLCKVNNLFLENPGYHKISEFSNNMTTIYQDLDDEGVTIPKASGVLYTTSFNQFPTGVKMSISRKKELANWAIKTNSYIIEDDFDAEFRINSNPTTSLYSIIPDRVIFFSTFSTTLFPGIRLSYAIIPSSFNYSNIYNHLSNPVSTLIQLAVKEFINKGYYSKLINSIKKKYIIKRNEVIKALEINNIKYDSKRNYLSLLIEYPLNNDLKKKLLANGILINSLEDYDYYKKKTNIAILGYTGIKLEDISTGIDLLNKLK